MDEYTMNLYELSEKALEGGSSDFRSFDIQPAYMMLKPETNFAVEWTRLCFYIIDKSSLSLSLSLYLSFTCLLTLNNTSYY